MNRLVDMLKYWLPAMLWAAGIFYLSSIPGLKSSLPSAWDLILRKGAHVAEYAVLAALMLRALDGGKPKKRGRVLIIALTACLLYAVSDEYHQTFVFGRSGSPYDAGIDAVGIAIGAVAFGILGKGRKK